MIGCTDYDIACHFATMPISMTREESLLWILHLCKCFYSERDLLGLDGSLISTSTENDFDMSFIDGVSDILYIKILF
jgi:hypothetical protein